MGLKFFLEDYAEFKIKGQNLKFKSLSVENLFNLLVEEQRFIHYLFEGAYDDNDQKLQDPKLFTKHIYSKYPTVILAVLALTYVCEEGEELTYQEKKDALNNLDFNEQLKIFEAVSERTFKSEVFNSVEKTKAVILKIKNQYGLMSD